MPIVQSAASQTSIVVPTPPTPVIDMVVALPEAQNRYHAAMAQLLPYYVYNSSTDFTVPQTTPVQVSGAATPGVAVLILVNGVSQAPTTNIVADQDGKWSTTIVLNPGQNLITTQYQS